MKFNREKFLEKVESTHHKIHQEGEFYIVLITDPECIEEIKSSLYRDIFKFNMKPKYIYSIQDKDYFYKECGAIFCSKVNSEIVFRKSES